MTEVSDFITGWSIILALALFAAPAFADECAEYRAELDAVADFTEPFPEPDRITPAFRAVLATTEPRIAALTAIQTALDAAKVAKTLHETALPMLEISVVAKPTELPRAIRFLERILETRQRTMVTFHETIFLAHCARP